MTKLASLRARLADLRRRRQAVRWATGYAALGLAVLWALVVAFLVDWSFQMTKPQRLVSLVLCVGVVLWAVRRFTLPWLGQRETDLDMALLVERQQKIDSDLVAALQFESPEAARWGSTQLEGAVVDYVAEFGKGWNVLEGFSRQELVRRAAALSATVALLALAVAVFPGHAGAFLNRFLLGSAHYPTRTNIDRIVINGKVVPVSPDGVPIKTAYGRPLKIEVHGSGELPSQGRAELQTVASGLKTGLDLAPPAGSDSGGQSQQIFSGQLPKLVDSLTLQLYLGDAWTDPAVLQVIALPAIEPTLSVTPPSYARGVDLDEPVAPGARQISVIEGSQVALEVKCSNKPLTEAVLLIDGNSYALKASANADPAGHVWVLEPAHTPFERIDKPTRYEIQVTDEDGLQLEQPVQGFIRIKADQRPRITAEVVTRFVLPSATPLIEYRATDDFGVGKVLLHLQAVRGENASIEEKTLTLVDAKQPVLRNRLPLKGVYPLKLAGLGLAKGDQLKVTLEVVDFRGPVAGLSASSEPLTLQVTDESGILAAISESDERSARQLDAIIQRQLGIGGSK